MVYIEHDYEVIRHKTADGTIRDGYFLLDGEPEIMDVIPGTHTSNTFMPWTRVGTLMPLSSLTE